VGLIFATLNAENGRKYLFILQSTLIVIISKWSDLIFWEIRETRRWWEKCHVNNEKLSSQSHHGRYLLFFVNHTYFPLSLRVWSCSINACIHCQATVTANDVHFRFSGKREMTKRKRNTLLSDAFATWSCVDNCRQSRMTISVKLTLMKNTKLYPNNTLMSSIYMLLESFEFGNSSLQRSERRRVLHALSDSIFQDSDKIGGLRIWWISHRSSPKRDRSGVAWGKLKLIIKSDFE